MVVVGKGGVGKSTVTALLCRLLARRGEAVVAVDADEQMNLGAALGFASEELAKVTPLALDAGYVEEKTGARPGEGAGAMLRLNPDVADVVERLALPGPDGVRLLVMGSVQRAGGGCLCPENSLLAATVRSMRLRRHEVVVMDTHAGVEHFGRAVARGFDQAVVMVDPTFNGVQVGARTARLAADLGITSLHLVVNRVRRAGDLERALDYLGRADAAGALDFSSVRELPYDEKALDGEPSVAGLLGESALGDAVGRLAHDLVAGLAADRDGDASCAP